MEIAMSIYEDGIPTLLDDIHSIPTRLERINSLEWPKAVAGSGNADVTVAERHLQDFLVRCPTILPLQHFSSTFHPSICIGREVSTGAGSIDCLFISGQGRLTIVETKLHKNPEARRAVVAQLLEYCDQVSNAQLFTNVDHTQLRFHISSNRFLAGMIRIIMGKLLEVGDGNLSVAQFEEYLKSNITPKTIIPVYAQGLYLSKVTYPYLDLEPRPQFSKFLRNEVNIPVVV